MKIFITILITLVLILGVIYSLPKSPNPKLSELEKVYKKIVLKDFFVKKPNKQSELHFGYICPGAIKTVNFLTQKSKTTSDIKNTKEIIKYTDALFYIEIIALYKEYISAENYNIGRKLLGSNTNMCRLASKYASLITKNIGQLSAHLKENLPDDFYHIRHETLVCSKNKKIAQSRIDLIKSIYA